MKKCDLCDEKGKCGKLRLPSKCEPSSIDWFYEEVEDCRKWISIDRVCRKSSIFGNNYIGLTEEDVTRLKNGEVIYIGGKYGVFVAFVGKKEEEE